MEMDIRPIVKRFQKYIDFNTTSNENTTACPSSIPQLKLAQYIMFELRSLGLMDAALDPHGYIYVTIPSNGCDDAPTVGFIAHMDTSPDIAGGPVNEKIVKNYDGGDILLNHKQNIVLSPEEFPELLDYIGQDIMVTDGTTLLGADDKAGIAAIMSAAEYLVNNKEIKHGRIRIAFTPDEEISRGADKFDVKGFGADFAYTVDGGALGGIEYENFNAASATLVVEGRNVHSGYAKGKMVNAINFASKWVSLLPDRETPEKTEGHEGFYHVTKFTGGVESAEVKVLIRDHDKDKFNARKTYLEQITEDLSKKYGKSIFSLTIKDNYYNMKEKIERKMYVVDLAKKAMENLNIQPICTPIRGGTDGARLSFMGLPCPNIFTGGLNYHGRYEYLPLPSLRKATETVVEISRLAGELKDERD